MAARRLGSSHTLTGFAAPFVSTSNATELVALP